MIKRPVPAHRPVLTYVTYAIEMRWMVLGKRWGFPDSKNGKEIFGLVNQKALWSQLKMDF